VTTPLRTPRFLVTAMLRLNAATIIEKIAEWPERVTPARATRKTAREQYELHKEKARQLAEERLATLNQHYGFIYRRISIRDQKTRWGSCSKKGNLNFSYKIALMPAHLADYIIAHELCHLGAFDHSLAFWSLVAQTVPNHKACRRELRSFRLH
jgi:predicted metal-dependent hydrolase